MGARKQPFYRIVVADSRSPRDGRFIESIGYYDPTTDPPRMSVKGDRANYWLQQGAQPTGAALSLLKKHGLLGGQPQEATAEPKKPKAPVRKKAKATPAAASPAPAGEAETVAEAKESENEVQAAEPES